MELKPQKGGETACAEKRCNSRSTFPLTPENCYQILPCFTSVTPIWILISFFRCEPVSWDAPRIPRSVRTSSGKGPQFSEGPHWRWKNTGQNKLALSSRATCLRSPLPQALVSLFFSIWLCHSCPHTTLSGKGMYESTRQALFSQCLCLRAILICSLQEMKTKKESDLVAYL